MIDGTTGSRALPGFGSVARFVEELDAAGPLRLRSGQVPATDVEDQKRVQNLDGHECPSHTLPASGLEHLGFFQSRYGQAFHGALEVFADFK